MALIGTIRANPQLLRLELAWAAVSGVRWAQAILVALYAYSVGGTNAVALAALVRAVPAAMASPSLGMIADRLSRRTVLIGSTVVRFVLTVGMAVTVSVDGALALVLGFAAFFAVADAAHEPAQAALIPLYARNPAELAAANAAWIMLDNGGFVLGSAAVGVLVASASLAAGFTACAVVLIAAGTTLTGLPKDVPMVAEDGVSAIEEWLGGARAISRSAQLRTLMSLSTVNEFVQAILDVLLVVTALGFLAMGGQGAGWLSAAWGVGGVLGGIVSVAVLARRRMVRGLACGLVLSGVPLIAIDSWPKPLLAVAALVIVGVGFGLVEVALLSFSQRLIAADVIARVYGFKEMSRAVATACGALAAAGLVAGVGPRHALIAAGLVLPLCAILPLLRRLEDGATPVEGSFELLRAVPAFAPLAVATVETLALRSYQVTVEAGTEIIRQGDLGDAFYVIKRGTVAVFENGVFRRTESHGDYFGEIALIQNSLRTASVKATSQVELLVLDRAEFNAAVATHAYTRHSMESIATTRLAPTTESPPPMKAS